MRNRDEQSELDKLRDEIDRLKHALYRIVRGESGETLWSVKGIAQKALEESK